MKAVKDRSSASRIANLLQFRLSLRHLGTPVSFFSGVWEDQSAREQFGGLVEAGAEKRCSRYAIRAQLLEVTVKDRSAFIHLCRIRFRLASPNSHSLFAMSSAFTNRRKPRKVGGDDEEEGGSAGLSMTSKLLYD